MCLDAVLKEDSAELDHTHTKTLEKQDLKIIVKSVTKHKNYHVNLSVKYHRKCLFFFFFNPLDAFRVLLTFKGALSKYVLLVSAVFGCRNAAAIMHWRKCSEGMLGVRSKCFIEKERTLKTTLAHLYFKKHFLYLSVWDFWWFTRDWHKRPRFNSSCEEWLAEIAAFIPSSLRHCTAVQILNMISNSVSELSWTGCL